MTIIMVDSLPSSQSAKSVGGSASLLSATNFSFSYCLPEPMPILAATMSRVLPVGGGNISTPAKSGRRVSFFRLRSLDPLQSLRVIDSLCAAELFPDFVFRNLDLKFVFRIPRIHHVDFDLLPSNKSVAIYHDTLYNQSVVLFRIITHALCSPKTHIPTPTEAA